MYNQLMGLNDQTHLIHPLIEGNFRDYSLCAIFAILVYFHWDNRVFAVNRFD